MTAAVEVHYEVDVDLGVDGVEPLVPHGVGPHRSADRGIHRQPLLVPTDVARVEGGQRQGVPVGVERGNHEFDAQVQGVPRNPESAQAISPERDAAEVGAEILDGGDRDIEGQGHRLRGCVSHNGVCVHEANSNSMDVE
ncbi:hypothetical protein J2S90_003937 [Arthrobacter bambusae]|uniref:Uncharacterized protein n=1 Tax=Arthrobacter bambusae TaxID=1338426 RepID=A0AAW8DL19_9MICC|nr:hypothetical protein [Arthrobacter bambusae]MDQ0130734.1 hypothetical protein [Arthrobacter bambusae]MDQ0182123.1 hypothetical protein [Arthrobacter bambusae]